MIDLLFHVEDRDYAKRLYALFYGKDYLLVDLGDSEWNSLSKESFFESATFYLFAVPGDSGLYGILGVDMDDPLGMVAVRKEDGAIVYLYDDSETVLATDLQKFVDALHQAGWRGP